MGIHLDIYLVFEVIHLCVNVYMYVHDRSILHTHTHIFIHTHPQLYLPLTYTFLFIANSFGTLMTASLKWRGCPAYILGLARGLAALIGIFATISYPFLQARLQTLKAGLVAILLQVRFATL